MRLGANTAGIASEFAQTTTSAGEQRRTGTHRARSFPVLAFDMDHDCPNHFTFEFACAIQPSCRFAGKYRHGAFGFEKISPRRERS